MCQRVFTIPGVALPVRFPMAPSEAFLGSVRVKVVTLVRVFVKPFWAKAVAVIWTKAHPTLEHLLPSFKTELSPSGPIRECRLTVYEWTFAQVLRQSRLTLFARRAQSSHVAL